MKIQCNVCQLAEANVVCCADEAALCWACDDKVHAANKLASKHQRVPLTTSASQIPNCDICQETVGYFFCLEDRALLCRKCDVAIHTANTFVSAHQRFLLTGVKVAPDPDPDPDPPQSVNKTRESHSMSTTNTPDAQLNKMPSMQIAQLQDQLLFTGDTAIGTIPQWHLDDFLGPTDFNHTYAYMGNGSSKADDGKLGDSDDSSILRAGEEELDGDECLGQVPDSHWAVPHVCSPPTASGIYWPKTYQNQPDVAAFVPDICHSQLRNFNRCQPNGSSIKRRRQI